MISRKPNCNSSFLSLYSKELSETKRINHPIYSRLMVSSNRKASENSTQSKNSISTDYSYKTEQKFLIENTIDVSFLDLNDTSFNSSFDGNSSDIEEIEIMDEESFISSNDC